MERWDVYNCIHNPENHACSHTYELAIELGLWNLKTIKMFGGGGGGVIKLLTMLNTILKHHSTQK